MSGKNKNWAEQESSDEGSLVDEEEFTAVIDSGKSCAEKSLYAVQPPEPSTSQQQQQQHQRRHQHGQRQGGGFRGGQTHNIDSLVAFVNFIDAEASRAEVGSFFEVLGCAISRLELFPPSQRKLHDQREHSKQSAMIEFKDRQSMDICLRANGARFGESLLRTSVYRPPGHSGNAAGRRGPPAADNRGRRGERTFDVRADHRSGSAHGSVASADAASVPSSTPPTGRPKIVLQPRTKPLEEVGKPAAANPSIFGGGRPREEMEVKVIDESSANPA